MVLMCATGYAQSDADLADAYFQKGECDKVVSLYQKVLRKDFNKIYLRRYISCVIKLKEFEDAEKFSKRRIRGRFGPEDVMQFCRYFGLPVLPEPTCDRTLLVSFMEPSTVQRSFSYREAQQDQCIEIAP